MKPGEMVRRWTDQEIQFLKDNSEILSWSEIGAKLGRTKSAVQEKAIVVGVRKTKEFITKRSLASQFKPGHVSVRSTRVYANAWKEEDYKFVRDNYESMTCEEIALHLKRTAGAIKTVASKTLKLKKSSEAKKILAKRPNAGHFKKGNLPVNTSADMVVSIRTTNGLKSKWIRIQCGKWKQLHHYNWEKAGNEIPKGFVLVFIDRDPLNCSVENLKLVKRGPHSRFDFESKQKIREQIRQEREAKRAEKLQLIEQAKQLKWKEKKDKQEARELAKLLKQSRKETRILKTLVSKMNLDEKAKEREDFAARRRQRKQDEREFRKAQKQLQKDLKTQRALELKQQKLEGKAAAKQLKKIEKLELKLAKREHNQQERLRENLQEQAERSSKAKRDPIMEKAKAERLLAKQKEKEALQRDREKEKALQAEQKRMAKIEKERQRIERERLENTRLPTRKIDMSQLIPLRIDSRTVIYIKPGVDPDQARQRYLSKTSHQNDFRL